MNARRLLNDLKLTASGIGALGRYVCSRDDLSLALSSFSSRSGVARPGEPSRYEVTLANDTSEHRWGRLFFDIYLQDNATHPEDHHSWFQKAVFVRSRESQRVEVIHDWRREATFRIDGIALAPDAFWRGPCETGDAHYVVKAVLFDGSEHPAETLSVVQRLGS